MRKTIIYFMVLGFWSVSCNGNKNENVDWAHYLGDKASSQYQDLSQIIPANVTELEPAWSYSTGDHDVDGQSQIQCNPLIVDGVLYGTSPKLKLFALNADTGEELWVFDPFADLSENLSPLGVNRGVVYWEDGDDRRILFSANEYLFAIDAGTGKPISTFGTNGRASLKAGLGEEAQELFVVSNTPGIVFKNLLIIGTRVSENVDAAPGFIRAYNILTGEVAWIFKTIPGPGEFGVETWPDEAHTYAGGANSWAGMALDEQRGIVYIPTGSASYDFYGGNRKGENLFANCLLALDASTGERIWHYQIIHHDLWDRDLPLPPNLITVEKDGRVIDAVAQATKHGFVFVFDRETGEPIWPIEEIPVPESTLVGEEAWPTQPIPTHPAPFTRQAFAKDNLSTIDPGSKEYLDSLYDALLTGERFIPPSAQGSLIFPGFDGGGEWGGAAYDSNEGIMYINAREFPCSITMINAGNSGEEHISRGRQSYLRNCAICHGQQLEGNDAANYPDLVNMAEKMTLNDALYLINQGKGFMPAFGHLNTEEKELLLAYLYNQEESADAHDTGKESTTLEMPFVHTGYTRLYDLAGYPAIEPPWGTLTALNINSGKIKWQVPLGEFKELIDRGLPPTGTGNYGGPVVTSGGVIFIAATQDELIRAFDKNTGEELWRHSLPAAGYATPATYMVNGKQYVVIACGGGKMNSKTGDTYMAFALPD